MDQAIVKIHVVSRELIKNSYPQKNIIRSTANIRAFINVFILKITEILEYWFNLMLAV